MVGSLDLDAKLADRRVGQKIAAEQCVVIGLDGTARAETFDPLGAAAAGAVQGEPVAAGLQPVADRAGLGGIGVRAGDIGDQQLAQRQPFRDIGEIVGDRGRDVALGEKAEQAKTGIIMVVAAHRAGRKAAGDQMRAARCCFCHLIPPGSVAEFGRVFMTD